MRFAFSLNACVLFLALPSLCLAADAAGIAPCVQTQTPIHDGVLYALMGVVVAAVFFINSKLMNMLLSDPGWSLAKALSEPQPVEVTTSAGSTAQVQNVGPAGGGQQPAEQPAVAANTEKVFAPSTSRLIAMLGTVTVSMLFMGYGVVVVWYLGKTGCMPGLENLTTFLVGGSSLFAPYIFNKLTNAISFKQ
ncbi:hypothetical protein [Fundidesulfovibrio soli]|uniref:hypothetical protein n=1 Tax=Fundidesulfovibrio soli TaxID=2922716 RepID=UPI001FAEA478|nr:hypothetical protein [Fundidesulfovibrio soli]